MPVGICGSEYLLQEKNHVKSCYGPNATENSIKKMHQGILLLGTDLWHVLSSAMQESTQIGLWEK